MRLIGRTPGGGRDSLTGPPPGRLRTYDAAVSIAGELERARTMAFASDDVAARDLLLSLIPQIEQADRDDFMLEAFAQLGQIFLIGGANDTAQEFIRRIGDCLAIYSGILAGTTPELAAQVEISDAEVAHMICRYSRRAQFLQTGLAAAQGDHEAAAAALALLRDSGSDQADLADEHAFLVTYAQVLCAAALCDDDLHVRALPLWDQVLSAIDGPGAGSELSDYLRVIASTGYGRFCVETGRLSEADPWLRRAGARAEARGWELAFARTQLERATACWSARDRAATERLAAQAYPVIARYARTHDLARCWLYLGLTRLARGALEAADECWNQAELQWRHLGKPLHLHRILLQRSWIPIFRGRFSDAVELIAQARECLDSSPRSSWLQYAQLDNHLGSVWRADALTDLDFDAVGDPSETWQESERSQAAMSNKALGIVRAEVGSAQYQRAMPKLAQAAELKVPAALAVDSVRYSIADTDARSRWARAISAPTLAGAFAVAWEWDNTELVSELIEYHSARGTFNSEPHIRDGGEWESTATVPVLADTATQPPSSSAISAGGPSLNRAVSLTRLGPLPPLQMQPDAPPILGHYRALALQRYGRAVTAGEPAWSTCP